MGLVEELVSISFVVGEGEVKLVYLVGVVDNGISEVRWLDVDVFISGVVDVVIEDIVVVVVSLP